MHQNKKKYTSGISPVIGIVLLVALTVALVALTAGVLFEVGEGTVSTTPIVEVEIIQSNDIIEVTMIENENIDELYVLNENGVEVGGPRISKVGETYTLNPTTDDVILGERLVIIVEMNDSDVVLQTFETK